MLLILHVLIVVLWASHGHTQTPASCSHWASPQGQGSSCSASQPCKVQSFWALAGPGKTLCLRDGTYRGSDSMISPPAGLKGTQAQPITIRAEHDGQVLLDAAHQDFAVNVGWHDGRSNDWFVVEGVNGKNGLEAIMSVAGSHSVLKRVIAWDGTSGAPTQGISVVGYGSRAEDCAGWGMNVRKIFQGSQSGNLLGAGYRRCWGEFNDWPQSDSGPTNTLQIGYNSTNQLFENMVMTWDTLDQGGETEGIVGAMTTNTAGKPNEVDGTRLLGSILYVRPGSTYSPATVFQSQNTTGFSVVDLAMVVPPGYPTKYPAYLHACSTPACSRNVCTNCLAVHDGRPVTNMAGAGWTLPGLRQGKGLAAATGGRSAFELLPGICKRYVGGQLTNDPLWPWPMNDRIKAARVASGYAAVDVTATVEKLLGTIPETCKHDGTVPPGPGPDTTRPQVQITAPSHEALVSGTAVAVAAEASDNVGVVSITFLLDEVQVGEVYTGGEVHVIADSTKVPNGVHKLRAVARDAADNESVGGTIDVTIFNSPAPPPDVVHVPLACSGEVLAGGKIDLVCNPQAARR